MAYFMIVKKIPTAKKAMLFCSRAVVIQHRRRKRGGGGGQAPNNLRGGGGGGNIPFAPPIIHPPVPAKLFLSILSLNFL